MKTGFLGAAFLLAAAAAVCVFVVPAIVRGQGGAAGSLEERVAALEKKINAIQASAPRLAFVDLEKLVNDCPQMERLRKVQIKYRDAETEKLKALKASIDESRRKQGGFAENSGEWWNWEKTIRPRQIEYEMRGKQITAELFSMEMKNVETVYKKVLAAIAKLAKEKDYTLVLWNPPPISDEIWEAARRQGNPLQHRYMIDVRPILYCGEKAVDVTADVLEILKKEPE